MRSPYPFHNLGTPDSFIVKGKEEVKLLWELLLGNKNEFLIFFNVKSWIYEDNNNMHCKTMKEY